MGDGLNKMMVLWVHDFSTSGLLPVRLDINDIINIGYEVWTIFFLVGFVVCGC